MTRDSETITRCRVCGGRDLVEVLDLGSQPLANSLKDSADAPEARYPLRIGHCASCSLIQLLETVRKEILFETYVWVTGTASGTREYAEEFCRRARARSRVTEEDLVLEVASNDGTFLKPFKLAGHPVLGVDPAANISEMARSNGVETVTAFFDRDIAARVLREHGPARLAIARNVIPHVSELHDVVAGIADVLAEDGTGIIEFHDAGKILSDLHYDSIYHEHLCYFSLGSMSHLLGMHGLAPFDLDRSPISGGSYVLYFSKDVRPASPALEDARAQEVARGVAGRQAWVGFAERTRQHRSDSLACIALHAGDTVVGFGASARSSTYLNYCGITSEDVAAVIDNNRLKQGRFTAGSSIPIVSFEEGVALNPAVMFVLGWNFLGEIRAQCAAAGYSGTYLVPFPGSPRFLEPERA